MQISEKAPNGLNIFKFSAYLANIPVSYQYNLAKTSRNDREKFNLDIETGIVTLKAGILDYEVQSKFFLYVIPINNISRELGSEALLTVELINVNDNNPIFTKDTYQMNIDENSNVGSVVGRVFANDHDKISNGNINFYMLRSQHSSMFAINLFTGQVTVRKDLDYENGTKFYILTVCANDTSKDSNEHKRGAEARTSCAIVEISVLNIMDVVPEFAILADTIRLSEKTPANTPVYRLSADSKKEPIKYFYDMSKTPQSNSFIFPLNALT